MGTYLGPTGLAYLWNKIKSLFATKKSVVVYNATENTSGTAAVTSKPYTASIWRVDLSDQIDELYTGLTILFKIPVAGNGSYGTLLRIDGTTAAGDSNSNLYPVCANVTTMVSTRYAVGCIVALTFDADQAGQTLYYASNSAYTTASNGSGWTKKGCWKIADYDANTTITYGTLDYYFRPYTAARLTPYKIVALDKDNRVIPITTEQYCGKYSSSTSYVVDDIVSYEVNSTTNYYICIAAGKNKTPSTSTSYWQAYTMPSQFTPTTTPFRPEKLRFYNTTTLLASGAATGGQTLIEIGYSTSVCPYTFWATIPSYKVIYLQGTYNKTTGLFTLDSGSNYYKLVPDNTANLTLSNYFTNGKYYILLGSTYSSNNYFQLFQVNTMYYFDGTNLVPFESKLADDAASGKQNILSYNTTGYQMGDLSVHYGITIGNGGGINIGTSNPETINASKIQSWDGKQDAISDLSDIRSGASAGASAIQTVKVNGTALTPDANKAVDISATPKISSSTDNAVVRFDGTGGTIQNSGVTINDSNHVTAAKFITSGGTSSQFVKGDGSLTSISNLFWANKALQTQSDDNTAPTFSPSSSLKYVLGTNYSVGNAQIWASPVPKYYWHDLFAFGRAIPYPKVEVSTDGTTWSDADSTFAQTCKGLFASKENQSITLLNDARPHVRFTWSGGNCYSNLAQWLVIGTTWDSKMGTCTITKEDNKADGTLTVVSTTTVTDDASPHWIKTTNSCQTLTEEGKQVSGYNVHFFKITFSRTSASATNFCVSSIKYLTYRWGNQGAGSEYEYPYQWDANANIYPIGAEKELGNTSYRWKVYGTNGNFNNSVTASSFIKSGGTSSQFLKADGSVDNNTYLTSFTETDPVYSASAASGITSTDILNWNGKADASDLDEGFYYGEDL